MFSLLNVPPFSQVGCSLLIKHSYTSYSIIEVELIYKLVLASGVQQRDSDI